MTIAASTGAALAHMEMLFAAFAAGDTDTVVAGWHEDAVWHPVTPGGPWTEPKTRDEYFGEVLASWYAERPDYVIADVQLVAVGGLVVAGLLTSAGRGILVYRVVDGKVAECWSVNADGSDSTDGF
jgi:ketosteroid isomerase-like protein